MAMFFLSDNRLRQELISGELNIFQLRRNMYLLKSESDDVNVVSRSLEPRLDDMNLNLSVVRVLEASNVPRENLISFFKWAAG
ncbi:hypothetical protein QVD17_36869 [Tagetes erecta]|uniref:Uncharacterized protein n=1 Tax=Tagetes erecta TaxID=13708 RepID=A0AAD8JT82_TARER|nr:hypothetical protein QVD17_36868 [Tagetes erecta]KAK1410334.1 hypothetical protein QVD17_36869 [Tagetes erecta]